MKKKTSKKAYNTKAYNNMMTAALTGCTALIEACVEAACLDEAANAMDQHVFRMSTLSLMVATYITMVADDLDTDAAGLANKFHEYLVKDLEVSFP